MKFPQLSLLSGCYRRIVSSARSRVFIFSAVFLSSLLLPFSHPSQCRADGPAWPPILETARDANGRLYVITSEKGGLFSSDNGGKNWKYLGGTIPSSNLFSLRVSPGGRLFLSTFDELLVSADGGETWKTMKGGGGIRLFSEGSGGTFLAVHWDRGLLWASKENPEFEKARGVTGDYTVLDVLDGGAPGIWAASFGGGVLFSEDEGRTWCPDNDGLTNQFVLCLAWAPETKALFAGTLEGGVYRKEVGGSWTPSSEGLPQGVSVQALAVGENGVIWAGTHTHGLFLSPDGGGNWRPLGRENGETVSVTSILPLSGGAMVGTYGSGLFLAEYEKESFTALLPSDPVAGIIGTGDGVVRAISSSGQCFSSSDGGISWHRSGNTGGRAPVSFLFQAPEGRLYSGVKGGILLSEDRGRTWTMLSFPDERTPFAMAVSSDGSLFAAAAEGGLFRSPDGRSWHRVDGIDGTYIYALDSHDGVRIAAGTDRGFSVSADGGMTWANHYVIYGIHTLAFDNGGRLWGYSRNGLWNYPFPPGEVSSAKIAGHEWSPLGSFSKLFRGVGNSLYALRGGSLVRLVPREGEFSFSMEPAGFSNAEVLSFLPVSRGGMLLGTRRGFFRSADGTGPWTEIELP
ncbi:MAG: hypothetical protein PHS90_12395 [Synergistaceae bacterium]|nr:hypothetical protein [Synergistaceae bacterium]